LIVQNGQLVIIFSSNILEFISWRFHTQCFHKGSKNISNRKSVKFHFKLSAFRARMKEQSQDAQRNIKFELCSLSDFSTFELIK